MCIYLQIYAYISLIFQYLFYFRDHSIYIPFTLTAFEDLDDLDDDLCLCLCFFLDLWCLCLDALRLLFLLFTFVLSPLLELTTLLSFSGMSTDVSINKLSDILGRIEHATICGCLTMFTSLTVASLAAATVAPFDSKCETLAACERELLLLDCLTSRTGEMALIGLVR